MNTEETTRTTLEALKADVQKGLVKACKELQIPQELVVYLLDGATQPFANSSALVMKFLGLEPAKVQHMTVQSATIGSSLQEDSTIQFFTRANAKKGDVVELVYNGTAHYFKVTAVEEDPVMGFGVSADETGLWHSHFNNHPVDPSTLIGCKLRFITDTALLEHIDMLSTLE